MLKIELAISDCQTGISPLADEGDIQSVIFSLCDWLYNHCSIFFRVSGFGDASWPIDASMELPLLIEQLPVMLAWIDDHSKTEFALQFYEQGFDVDIKFRKAENSIVAECVSFSAWQPLYKQEYIETIKFRQEIIDFLRPFVIAAKLSYPDLAYGVTYQQWLSPSKMTVDNFLMTV